MYGVRCVGHDCRLAPGDAFRELNIGGADTERDAEQEGGNRTSTDTSAQVQWVFLLVYTGDTAHSAAPQEKIRTAVVTES